MTDKDHKQDKQEKPEAVRALSRLDALVGEWEFEPSIEGQLMARDKCTFKWLEGGSFLA